MRIYWETYTKEGWNPKEEKTNIVERRRIVVNNNLPIRDEYIKFLNQLLESEKKEEEK